MNNLRSTIILAALILLCGPAFAVYSVGPLAYQALVSQVEEVAPVADPFLEELNRELDTRAAGTAQTSAPAPAQPVEQAPTNSSMYYLRVFSSLCLVVALILFIGYLMRRFGQRTPLLAGVDLGQVLGRVYLAKGATLYYVASGGRVLVIGVTNNAVSLVAEFDESAFDISEEAPYSEEAPQGHDTFLAQLRQSTSDMRGEIDAPVVDDEISSLREDIERLQLYLREESRELKE